MSHETQPPVTESAERSTFVNALIGAVVSIVLSVLPFSPVIGGAVAGYLERSPDDEKSLTVGALSGVIAAVPIIVVFGLLFGGVALAAAFGGEPVGGAMFALVMAVVVLFSLLFIVGFSAVGGLVGAVLYRREAARKRERDQAATATTGGTGGTGGSGGTGSPGSAGTDGDDAVPRI